jgi:hypothetical protein
MSFVWQGALQSAHMHSLVRFGWELVSVVNGKNWYKAKTCLLISSFDIHSIPFPLYREIVQCYILVSLFVSS